MDSIKQVLTDKIIWYACLIVLYFLALAGEFGPTIKTLSFAITGDLIGKFVPLIPWLLFIWIACRIIKSHFYNTKKIA